VIHKKLRRDEKDATTCFDLARKGYKLEARHRHLPILVFILEE
jgi:hypothetical protein